MDCDTLTDPVYHVYWREYSEYVHQQKKHPLKLGEQKEEIESHVM